MSTKLKKPNLGIDAYGPPRSPRSPSGYNHVRDALKNPFRIVATGTIFLTHSISIATFAREGSNVRAQTVTRHRGGAAAASLSVIAQFAGTQPWLVAPIGGGGEGASLRVELERERISTELCARRESEGVPKAFIIRSNDTETQTVINHNPIPDITHEEFIRLLGPLLFPSSGSPEPPSPGLGSESRVPLGPPLDWMHFEGRNAPTTLMNISGIDGWLREKDWRHRVVLSVEIGKPGRADQEKLIPLSDVIFFSKSYAMSRSHTSPRTFLLSILSSAPPHALLVVSWGRDGAGLLSVPTREYFQSSPFVPDPEDTNRGGVESVRTSSAAYWPDDSIDDDGIWTESWDDSGHMSPTPTTATGSKGKQRMLEEEDLDEVGAEDAFIGALIFALSRRLLPGAPYTPAPQEQRQQPFLRPNPPSRSHSTPASPTSFSNQPVLDGRWRLDECLRFATELAGRRMRRKGNEGLALAMERVGWTM